MNDLISKKALVKYLESDIVCLNPVGKEVKDLIIARIKYVTKPVEAVPVKHGEWEEDRMDYVCSACKTTFSDELPFIKQPYGLPNFCPNCGADMRKR